MTLKEFIGDSATGSGLIGTIIQPAVDLMFGAAVFFFLWNVFMMITKSDQPDEIAKFKSQAIWGLVAIAIMASVWGLIALVLGSTGLDTSTVIDIRTGP